MKCWRYSLSDKTFWSALVLEFFFFSVTCRLWLPKCDSIPCRVFAFDNLHILTIKFKYIWFCSIHSINLYQNSINSPWYALDSLLHLTQFKQYSFDNSSNIHSMIRPKFVRWCSWPIFHMMVEGLVTEHRPSCSKAFRLKLQDERLLIVGLLKNGRRVVKIKDETNKRLFWRYACV